MSAQISCPETTFRAPPGLVILYSYYYIIILYSYYYIILFRQGKFLLYWLTTTSTSTATSFTATVSVVSVYCTPS